MDFAELKVYLLDKANFEDKQWREIKAICDIRTGSYSAKAGAIKEEQVDVGDRFVNLFYDRVIEILLKQEKVPVAPLHVVRKVQPKTHQQIVQLSGQLYELSHQWNPTKVRGRNFAIGVFHLYVKLVVQYLRDCGVPLSVKTLVQHGDKFVGLVDKAFPGYVGSGLLHVVILGDKDGQNPAV